MESESKSIGWVVGGLVLVVGFFGWAFLAADFFQHDPNGQGGRTDFFGNAFAQIPNFGAVMSHAFANRLWLVILIVVLELVVLGFGILMKKVERELSRK